MQSPDLASDKPLLQRARKGVIWVGFVSIGAKLLSVATTLVLARILTPEDFGLVAVANVIVAALAIFTDLGLGAAIIHSKAPRQRLASTAFFVMPVIGLVLYILSYATAPFLADLLNNEAATPIIRIVSLTLLISSFALVPSILLEKDMAYKRKVLPDLTPTITYIVTVIILAKGFNLGAYSIAYALIVQAFTGLILNWIAARWKPSLIFDMGIAKELFGYGKNVLGGSVIGYLATNMDNAFISRSTGSAGLGFYTLGYSVANLPATHVGDVIGRVLFPSFVELNEQRERLRAAYTRALRLLVVVTFPLIAGIAAVANPFVHVVLGEKWLAIIPVLQILGIFTAFRVVSGATGSLFLATNNSRLILLNGIVGLTLQAIALYVLVVLYDSGLVGASWAVSLASLINSFYIAYYAKRIIGFSIRQMILWSVRLVLPSILMGGVVYTVTMVLPAVWWALLLQTVVGAIVYVLLLALINGTAVISEILSLARRR